MVHNHGHFIRPLRDHVCGLLNLSSYDVLGGVEKKDLQIL